METWVENTASGTGRKARRAPWFWVGAATLLLIGTFTGRPDTIYLRGGEKVVGQVVEEDQAKVVIRSQTLGRLEIPREKIERIERDAAPAKPSAAPGTEQPFVPPPPGSAAPSVSIPTTNAPPPRRWFWRRRILKDVESTDWIQLKSGEWLRGRLYGMQNRKLEFESDELEDLEFDWKDIHQVVAPKALVSYGERESAWGSLRVDRENVVIDGVEEVRIARASVVGIAPGEPRELDYWSGQINAGLNLRSGNADQSDLVFKGKLERRTSRTHLKLEYTGNYSEASDEETADNQRVSQFFDYFLTRRLFMRVPQTEYYRDPFQNLEMRLTAGVGMGYYIIDRPRAEWILAGGPAYQYIQFDTVEAGEPDHQSTPAFFLQSSWDFDLTKRTDLEVQYQAIAANRDSGGLTHHGEVTLEIDLTRRFDLDISFIWDRIGNPQADSSGDVPKKDDFRLNLSLGLKF